MNRDMKLPDGPATPDLWAELDKAFRLVTAPLRPLPSFLIPGSAKCGTSSLYDALRLHPDFATSKRKEPTNFIHHPTSALRSRMNFPLLAGSSKVAAEASVEYFTHPFAPGDIRRVVPEVKLVFMLRDPVRRAWSDYQMFRQHGRKEPPFEEMVRQAVRWLQNPEDRPLVEYALRMPHSPVRYVYMGNYIDNLRRWLEVFPRERFLFVFSEDYFRDQKAVFDRVCDFVGLRRFTLPIKPHARPGVYQKEWMTPEAERLLREYYAPKDAELAEFLGASLPWEGNEK